MSRLLSFYRGENRDTEGRLLDDILAWDDDRLEGCHDYIQWLFPLPDASLFNPDAPILTDDVRAAFRADPLLQANVRRSFARFLSFLGLALGADGAVVEGPNFAARVPEIWAFPNHNFLRITRALRSLKLLGMEAEAQALYAWLSAVYTDRRYRIATDTFQFWTEAVTGAPFHR